MVLFKEDIARTGAYIDTCTKNTSFLRMAILLNKYGVRNNTFMLALHDRDLLGVDPHNLTDPSVELVDRIAYEAKTNYWYYLRELVRVPSAGTDGIPFILNRANCAQAWLFLNSIDSFSTQPRQTGKTIGMCTACGWYTHLAGRKLGWGMFCQNSDLQIDNVKRVKEIRDALPKYLIHKSVEDSNNKEGLTYAALDTKLQTFIAQKDRQAADRQGRGATLPQESWDEFAYYVNLEISWNSATAAMNAAKEKARAAGLPASIMITSTAGDIDSESGAFAYRMVCDALRFDDTLYDAKDHADLVNIVKTNSKNSVVYIEYSWKQLGKTQEWFEDVTRNKKPDIIAKDYLNQWLHGSDNSVFTKEMMDKIVGSEREPVKTTYMDSLAITWYDDPDEILKDPSRKNKPYVLGCDTSDNVGRDFTGVVMLDPYDLHVVAIVRCSVTNFMFVSKCIAHILIMFPRAIIIPERNKNGAVLIDYLIIALRSAGMNPLKKIFNQFYQEFDPDRDLTNLNYETGLVRKEFGFTTTKSATSREMLYTTVMITALNLAATRLYDANLIRELAGLTTRNGRIDHTESGHDDMVISFLLAAFFIIFASNPKYYGVDADEFMCAISNSGEDMDIEDKKQLTILKARAEEIEGRLRRCDNSVIRSALKRELNKILTVLGDADIDVGPREGDMKPLGAAMKEASRDVNRRSAAGVIKPWEVGW